MIATQTSSYKPLTTHEITALRASACKACQKSELFVWKEDSKNCPTLRDPFEFASKKLFRNQAYAAGAMIQMDNSKIFEGYASTNIFDCITHSETNSVLLALTSAVKNTLEFFSSQNTPSQTPIRPKMISILSCGKIPELTKEIRPKSLLSKKCVEEIEKLIPLAAPTNEKIERSEPHNNCQINTERLQAYRNWHESVTQHNQMLCGSMLGKKCPPDLLQAFQKKQETTEQRYKEYKPPSPTTFDQQKNPYESISQWLETFQQPQNKIFDFPICVENATFYFAPLLGEKIRHVVFTSLALLKSENYKTHRFPSFDTFDDTNPSQKCHEFIEIQYFPDTMRFC